MSVKLPEMEIDLYDGRKLRIHSSPEYTGVLSIVDPKKNQGQEDYFFVGPNYDGRSKEVHDAQEKTNA